MFSFLHFNFISSEGIVIGINVSFINCSINKKISNASYAWLLYLFDIQIHKEIFQNP